MRGVLVSLVVHAGAIAGLLSLPTSSASEPPPAPPPEIREWPQPVARIAIVRPRAILPSRGSPARGGGGTPPVQPLAQNRVISEEPPAPEVDPFVDDLGVPSGRSGGEAGIESGAAGGPGETSQGPPTLVRAHVDVVPPRRLSGNLPVFPALARVSHIAGVVLLECTIDVDGRVTDVRVLKGHPLFDAAALEALRTWRYTPTRLNGRPVAVLMTVTVNFTLTGR